IGYALAAEDPTVRLASALARLGASSVPADVALHKRIFPNSFQIDLNAIPLSLFGPQVVRDGFRLRAPLVRASLDDGGRPTERLRPELIDKVFESMNRADDVAFRYSFLDASTGRELQNGLINNVAGLGIANGDRPFKSLARPMIFLPRSAIRVV